MKAIIVHSGGMDSSLCLAIAREKWGSANVQSISFRYDQRHEIELEQAAKICAHFSVPHHVIDCTKIFMPWQKSALVDKSAQIIHEKGKVPNTFVIGRNGIFAHIAGLWAHDCGADMIYIGIMELECANSGYPDCSRQYMDLMEQIIRLDLDNANFTIETPLVYHDKCSSLECAYKLGVLQYLLEETVTCYEGVRREECKKCPACLLRNAGIARFHDMYPEIALPYLPSLE